MNNPANNPAPKEWPDLPQSLDAALGFPSGWREQTNGSLKQQGVWANGFHNCRDQVLTAFEADPLCSASERDALAAEVLALRKRVEALDALSKLTFAIQHNPNCPSPWLVRLHGKGQPFIDLKPYSRFTTAEDFTKDVLGFGKTLEDAYRATGDA